MLTDTAETVLERRYYLKDDNGKPKEDWPDLCIRVATAVAQAEPKGKDFNYYETAFYHMIKDLDFLPNSPCLMNAGTDLGQLSACFVLPVEDSMEGIFTAVKHGALVHKTGGGTGYSFNSLRGKNAPVKSTQGIASGPLSFMEVFNTATETIKQGGKRRGANMAVLGIDHPDVLDFINAKEDETKFTNFNFSVAITDEFMLKVRVGEPEALRVFNTIVERAWSRGEPGVLFIDTANADNPIPHMGKLEATNPCGEQFLLPYESCNLGSINLGRFVRQDKGHEMPVMVVDWDRLGIIVQLAVRFLDNVIDVNTFPIPKIKEMTLKTRKIGLGIMGLHDMLIQMGIPYASDRGCKVASEVMEYINKTAINYSEKLADEKGVYPAYVENTGTNNHPARRNAVLTSIQPTGTLSMIADCASGCEPYFSTVMVKHVMDGDKLLMVNKHFKKYAEDKGLYFNTVIAAIADTGSVVGIPGIPEDVQQIFATAQDISPEDHILMQASLQEHVGSAISKTINMPANATKEDVKKTYIMAWHTGCKGVTVYRDGCRSEQVLNAGTKTQEPVTFNPEITATGIAHKIELPDVLDAKRYRLKDADDQTIYLIVCFDENGKPMEVFAKFSSDNRIENSERSTMWATVCRLTSLSLRCHVPMEEIIKQLDRASGSMFDLPAQLSKLLKSFMVEVNHQTFTSPCPDCNASLIFEEGCECCKSCGYSKCT
jgi:ribonucleoside-diphosphate reductase alpha chain